MRNGEVLAWGASSDTDIGYWGPKMGKLLGSISTVKGTRYKLIVDIEQTSEKLQWTIPRLRVEVDAKDLRWT